MRLITLLFSCVLAIPTLAQDLTIGAAVSLKEALAEIAQTYQADTGRKVSFIFGSSGQILAQIQPGAPVDAFISASDQ